jgi:ElaB/YqjD/DUF883 family membrane-anchored ribosome-binding protein
MQKFKELLEDNTGFDGLDDDEKNSINQELKELRQEAGGDKTKLKKLISSRSWPIELHKIMLKAGLKESLNEEDRLMSDSYKRYKDQLESLRFQKEEAIKKVTVEWNKKIEDLKKEYISKHGSATERLGKSLQSAFDKTYKK